MFGFDFTQAQTYAVPVGALLLVDFVLGAAAAFFAGSLKASWLYIFGRTKGVAYVMGVLLLTLAAVIPDLSALQDGNGVPIVPADFFGVMGLGFLSPLAVSLVASIIGNVNSIRAGGDPTAPTGAGSRPPAFEDGVILDEEVGA